MSRRKPSVPPPPQTFTPSGSPAINLMLGGGYPVGRLTEIVASEELLEELKAARPEAHVLPLPKDMRLPPDKALPQLFFIESVIEGQLADRHIDMFFLKKLVEHLHRHQTTCVILQHAYANPTSRTVAYYAYCRVRIQEQEGDKLQVQVLKNRIDGRTGYYVNTPSLYAPVDPSEDPWSASS